MKGCAACAFSSAARDQGQGGRSHLFILQSENDVMSGRGAAPAILIGRQSLSGTPLGAGPELFGLTNAGSLAVFQVCSPVALRVCFPRRRPSHRSLVNDQSGCSRWIGPIAYQSGLGWRWVDCSNAKFYCQQQC